MLIFSGPVLTSPDDRIAYGERRFLTIGALEGLIVVVAVHTDRGSITRLISARFANRKERLRYHAHLTAAAEDHGSPSR
ncbi:BrnT family toxin [Rhizobium sp. 0TCS1.26]|uniref:BrnT family toxin n=1 Tax=Rhizobium sp. 0TCS1.26 TaxID=3142623 RepID=UPI003D2D7E12